MLTRSRARTGDATQNCTKNHNTGTKRTEISWKKITLGAAGLPAATPSEVFRRPEIFGEVIARSGANDYDVTILRRHILLTDAEKVHMRRVATTHSLMRYEFTNPDTG